MVVLWKVRCFRRETGAGTYKFLVLNTETLTAPLRAAFEILASDTQALRSRQLVRFRSHFLDAPPEDELDGPEYDFATLVVIPDYFEDHLGTEIQHSELGAILTGDPKARFFPAGVESHDVALLDAPPPADELAEVQFLGTDVQMFATFCRDLSELEATAFAKSGPGQLSYFRQEPGSESGAARLETAANVEEIRSFAMVFRRLFMTGEPARFEKVAGRFVHLNAERAIAAWVKAERRLYHASLNAKVVDLRLGHRRTLSIKTQDLIGAIFYTRYLHQGSSEALEEYEAALLQVDGDRDTLFWLFLNSLWELSIRMRNVGRVIADWFRRYCDRHHIEVQSVRTVLEEHSGVGALEKDEVRHARIREVHVNSLARELWKASGLAEFDAARFREEAERQIDDSLNG